MTFAILTFLAWTTLVFSAAGGEYGLLGELGLLVGLLAGVGLGLLLGGLLLMLIFMAFLVYKRGGESRVSFSFEP